MTISGPLRLTPVVKEVVWGGRWLATELGRTGRDGASLGESWEAFSGSAVREGEWAGRTLGDLFDAFGPSVFGASAARYPRFPLLVKFIEARESLSIQVHPDDALALELEGYPYGKSEFWYILEAEPDAEIIYGLKSGGIGREELGRALQDQDLLRYCGRTPVRKGDVIHVPAGTVHALTAGVVVYELQQDSDITYRLYDWGRTDREMHLAKGLRAINTDRFAMTVTHPTSNSLAASRTVELAACDYFRSELLEISTSSTLVGPPHTFTLLTVIAGQGSLDGAAFASEPLNRGDTIFLPCGLETLLHAAGSGCPLSVIRSALA